MTGETNRATGWSVRHAVGALLAGVVAAIVAAATIVGVSGREPTDAELFGVVFAAQALATIAAVLIVIQRRGTGSPSRDVGLVFAWRDLWGIPAGFALQIALALTLHPLLDLLGIEGPPQEVGRLTQDARGATVALAFLSVVILAPVAEELLFRGLLLRALQHRRGEVAAVAISAAAFAALHLLDPGAAIVVPQLFVVGVVLAIFAVRSDRLGLAITTHAGFNLTALLALLAVAE